MRNKFMSDEEAKAILQHSGLPVELPTGSRPHWMNNLPSARIFASASAHCIGIEVYRDSSSHSEASSGYVWNQDIYSGYSNASGYGIYGPAYDPQKHWATGIPQQLSNVPVIDRENKTE